MRYNYTWTRVDKMKEIDYEKFWQEYEAICSLTASGNIQLYNNFRKQFDSFLKF